MTLWQKEPLRLQTNNGSFREQFFLEPTSPRFQKKRSRAPTSFCTALPPNLQPTQDKGDSETECEKREENEKNVSVD